MPLLQVHKACLHDGRVVAVKVQYLGLESEVAADMTTLAALSTLAGWLFPDSFRKCPALPMGQGRTACPLLSGLPGLVWEGGGLEFKDAGQRMGLAALPVLASLPNDTPALHVKGSSRIVLAINMSLDARGGNFGTQPFVSWRGGTAGHSLAVRAGSLAATPLLTSELKSCGHA